MPNNDTLQRGRIAERISEHGVNRSRNFDQHIYRTIVSQRASRKLQKNELVGQYVLGSPRIEGLIGYRYPASEERDYGVALDEASYLSGTVVCRYMLGAAQGEEEMLAKRADDLLLWPPGTLENVPPVELLLASYLERTGQIDRAMDVVYGYADDLLKAGNFEALNKALQQVNPQAFGTEVLLTILTVTADVAAKLPARTDLFDRIETALRVRPDWDDGLLVGLKA